LEGFMGEALAFLKTLWFSDSQASLAVHTALRLILAAVLGGVIGHERQNSHRPAGLRTHMLVAVGSALVMCTAEFIKFAYPETVEVSRLGAQVISGIGFLGAGTILREGFSVKGLTTAASLWAVSCIGLTVGIGFWPGAVIATLVMYLTLNALNKMVKHYTKIRTIYIGVENEFNASEKVAETLRNCGAKLRQLEIILPEDANTSFQLNKNTNKVLKAMAYVDNDKELPLIREGLLNIEGVNDLYIEN